MRRLLLIGLFLLVGCSAAKPGSRFYQPKAGILHPKDAQVVRLVIDDGSYLYLCVHPDGRVGVEMWGCHLLTEPDEYWQKVLDEERKGSYER